MNNSIKNNSIKKIIFCLILLGGVYTYNSLNFPFKKLWPQGSSNELSLSLVSSNPSPSFQEKKSNTGTIQRKKQNLERTPSQTSSLEKKKNEAQLRGLLKKWDSSSEWAIETLRGDIKSFSLGAISTRSQPSRSNSEKETSIFIHSLLEDLSEPLGLLPENLGETEFVPDSSHPDQQVYETQQFYQNIPVYGGFSRAFVNPKNDIIDQVNSEFKKIIEPVKSGGLEASQEDLFPLILASHPNNIFKLDVEKKWAPKKVVYVNPQTLEAEISWQITVSLYPEGDTAFTTQIDRRQLIIGTDSKRILSNISLIKN